MTIIPKAFETTGLIETQHSLLLDEPLPSESNGQKVKVIILLSDEIDEKAWYRYAMNNPSFDFLKEPEEDIYTVTDGKPFHV